MNELFKGLDTSSKVCGFIASRGLSYIDLAVILGRTTKTITARIKNQSWTVKELKIIANKYGVEASDLI